MNRRHFCASLAGWSAAALTPRWVWAADLPKDLKITRILAFDLVSRRCKLAGKNSHLDVHGEHGSDRVVRLFTNAGIDGLGVCRANEQSLTALLGKNPFDYFQPEDRVMKSPLGAATMALWDLAGKVLGKPVYELLGHRGEPKSVQVYDGSIYFTDLLPQYSSNWADRFKAEIDLGLKRGHRGFKAKVGRGYKWMPVEEGFERDKAVLKVLRQHAGPEIVLGIDSNNGYDLARTKRLLTDCPDLGLAFLEEMFPERVDQCLELKAFLAEHKLKALIADGETQSTLEPLKPFMEARAVDIFQGDMIHFGVEGIMREAAMARPFGLQVAPHNWGSLLGFYAMVQIAQAIPNFYGAENDPLDNDVLETDGYQIQNGRSRPPNAPGFGLKINEAKFAASIKPRLDLKL